MITMMPEQQTSKVNNVTQLQNKTKKKNHEVNLTGEIVDMQPGSVRFPRDYREMK